MKKLKIINKHLFALAACVLLLSFLSCSRILPYEKIRNWILYDHIEYNGVPYYIVEDNPRLPRSSNNTVVVEDTVYVIIVDENGEPYDATRQEEAWVFKADPERIYVYFNSAYYTKDRALASVHYGFSESEQ